MNILVTGANGFIGSALCAELVENNFNVIEITRHSSIENRTLGDIDGEINWYRSLEKVDCIVHTANIAHEGIKQQKINRLNYQKVNIDGTLNLAKQAINAGVKRFIYISSISVLVSKNNSEKLNEFTGVDESGLSIYARSKYIAEKKLIELTENSDMDLVIIRPPMVYGEKLIGNFGSLIKILKARVPIPFGSLESTRSFIYIGNLSNFLIKVINHPGKLNEILLISDDNDCKVKDFIRKVSNGLNLQSNLFPLPIFIVRIIINTLLRGKGSQLLDSLEMDISKAKNIFNWQPPYDIDRAIRKSCAGFSER